MAAASTPSEDDERAAAAEAILRDQAIEASRLLAERAYAAFVQEAWPLVESEELCFGRHHELICRDIEALFDLRLRNHVECVPPSSGKSSLCDVFHVPWLWTRDPGLRIGVFSFDSKKLLENGDHVLTILKSEWYLDRWGEVLANPNQAARGLIDTKHGGFRFVSTPGGKATSWHFDYTIFDDLCKPEQILAAITGPQILAKINRWRTRTMPSRVRNPRTHRLLCIGQRLHEDDPPGQMIREGATHRVLPMRFDPDHPQRDPDDWRTRPGELLQPERFDEAAVRALELTLGKADAAAQLGQNPGAPGGTFVSLEEICQTPRAFWPRPDWGTWGMSVDASFKKGEATSAVAIGVWQWSAANWWLHYAEIEKMGFNETCDAILRVKRAWPRVRRVLIEDKANGPAIIDHLKVKVPGIEPIDPGNESKAARFNAVTHYFRDRKVNVLPADGGPPWVTEWITQITKFPVLGRNDAVDMTSQALRYLGPSGNAQNLMALAEKHAAAREAGAAVSALAARLRIE